MERCNVTPTSFFSIDHQCCDVRKTTKTWYSRKSVSCKFKEEVAMTVLTTSVATNHYGNGHIVGL